MRKPNPQKLDLILTVEGVDEHKRYDCRTYARCLDIAEDAGWQQFHCNSCRVYVPLPKDDPSRRLFAVVGARLLKDGDDR